MNELVEKIIDFLKDEKNQTGATNIYCITPENPSYPHIKVSIANIYDFSTFSDNLSKIYLTVEQFAFSGDFEFINKLGKLKESILGQNFILDVGEILHKKFNKISLKQEKNILHGTINLEFLLKIYDKT